MKNLVACFLFASTTLLAHEHLAPAVRIHDDVRACAVCEKPLMRAEGFAPRPELRAHPDDTVALVISAEGDLFPNRRPWMFLSKPQRDWDVPATFEFCASCDAQFEARVKEVKSNAKLREELLRRLEAGALRVYRPNQALQPTRMLVTIRAYARLAPSTRVADL